MNNASLSNEYRPLFPLLGHIDNNRASLFGHDYLKNKESNHQVQIIIIVIIYTERPVITG